MIILESTQIDLRTCGPRNRTPQVFRSVPVRPGSRVEYAPKFDIASIAALGTAVVGTQSETCWLGELIRLVIRVEITRNLTLFLSLR